MADPRFYFKKGRALKMLILPLLMGSVWLASSMAVRYVGGQTPNGPPPPIPANKEIFSQPIPPRIRPPAVPAMMPPQAPPARFQFTIKADTALTDLLPIPPKGSGQTSPRLIDNISQVPEVGFQEPLAKTPDALKQTAHTIAKINHLNRTKADGFMEALLGARPDLAGLPVAMGDNCRMPGDRTQFFTQALNTIKQARGQGANSPQAFHLQEALDRNQQSEMAIKVRKGAVKHAQSAEIKAAPSEPLPPPGSPTPVDAPSNTDFVVQSINGSVTFTGLVLAQTNVEPDVFWQQYAKLCADEDKANAKLDPCQLEYVITARIAALMQVLAPDSVAMRKGLVKYLAATSHAEATRALAKLAIFSADDEIRNPAIDALKVRRERDYTEILLRGLRYPLPAVAKRATEAMTRLERTDLVPELVNFLEEPDPRSPTLKEMGEKKVPVMRELVRINHHRNCLMCHAPAVPNEFPTQVTTAEVPRPDQPLPSPSDGYSNSLQDLLVRLDVTYLRQDFSLLQPVANANPWPEMQRFDYLVRTRVLTNDEAATIPTPKAGTLSPYQRVALTALRELTGRDTAPTPAAWRELLDLPAREMGTSFE